MPCSANTPSDDTVASQSSSPAWNCREWTCTASATSSNQPSGVGRRWSPTRSRGLHHIAGSAESSDQARQVGLGTDHAPRSASAKPPSKALRAWPGAGVKFVPQGAGAHDPALDGFDDQRACSLVTGLSGSVGHGTGR